MLIPPVRKDRSLYGDFHYLGGGGLGTRRSDLSWIPKRSQQDEGDGD